MDARNKHTGQECEVWWNMCDCGRKCAASDQPAYECQYGCWNYNAVVDDYEFFVEGKWVDGLDYIKNPKAYYKNGGKLKIIQTIELE